MGCSQLRERSGGGACEIRLSSSEPFINIECNREGYLDFGFYLRGFKEGQGVYHYPSFGRNTGRNRKTRKTKGATINS